MPIPLAVGALGGVGMRLAAGAYTRYAVRSAAKQAMQASNLTRAASLNAANPAAAPTALQGVSGAIGAAGTGLATLGAGSAALRGDYDEAVVQGLGAGFGGARLASGMMRGATQGLSRLAAPAGTAGGTAAIGLGNISMNANGFSTGAPTSPGLPPRPRPTDFIPQEQGAASAPPTATTGGATTGAATTATASAQVDREAQRTLARDQELGANLSTMANVAGRNYQDITKDLRDMADRGPQNWQPRDNGMSEWEADTRRREIRMAYRAHPMPGKGEGMVLKFDEDLQKRREAIENARVAGYSANTNAFDKALGALGGANGLSAEFANNLYGQTTTRRGQDVATQKNLMDYQVGQTSANAQLLTSLGGLAGGKKDGSSFKDLSEQSAFLKGVAEAAYPSGSGDEAVVARNRQRVMSLVGNSEHMQTLQGLVANGAGASAFEYARNAGENIDAQVNSLGSLSAARAQKGGLLDGAGMHIKDMFQSGNRYSLGEGTYNVEGDTIGARDYAGRFGKAVDTLVSTAVRNPGASPGAGADGTPLMSLDEFVTRGGSADNYNSYIKAAAGEYLQNRSTQVN